VVRSHHIDIYDSFRSELNQMGAECRILSADHIPELESEINGLLEKSMIHKDVYSVYMRDYFDFSLNQPEKSVRSLIIVATPSPQITVKFIHENRIHNITIPPTYSDQVLEKIKSVGSGTFNKHGFKMDRIILPQKLIAVRSGLARYGKNNISYVPGMGSYHRLTLFSTDYESLTDDWQERKLLETCNGCDACQKVCPTKAISKERFILRAERCLTFFNEQSGPFPDWITPELHDSLVGCMKCQMVCPENKKYKIQTEFDEEFSQSETEMILDECPFEDLPEKLQDKINKLTLDGYYHVLSRNLDVLL
jgi:epoxyqueuosine reductase